MKESIIQKALVDTLTDTFPGIYVRKVHQSMYSHAGIPDLIGCLSGTFFAIEVKVAKGRVTKLQERELRLINEAGGIALICRGHRGIKNVIQILRNEAKETPIRDNKILFD